MTDAHLWSATLARTQVTTSCAIVAEETKTLPYFCLWLEGEVGAGKTYWLNVFLHMLGLPPNEVVTSPTYIYAREYEIAGKLYHHADLYRVTSINDFLALGIDSDNYHGEIYEWATPNNCPVPPTHRLQIHFAADISLRNYFLSRH